MLVTRASAGRNTPFTEHTYDLVVSETRTYLIRIWLLDRPGALGAVASRLGEMNGDLVGLEIIERSGGRAVDELVVDLPADLSVEQIAAMLSAERGVEVEDIRPLAELDFDPQLESLETAAILLGSDSVIDLAQALCDHARRCVQTDWACVIEPDSWMLAASGDVPVAGWIQSYIAGSPSLDRMGTGFGLDTEWVPLPSAKVTLVVGRQRVFRARERQRLAALARISDSWARRLKEAAREESMRLHPSR